MPRFNKQLLLVDKKFLSKFSLELSLTDPIFSARALDSLSPEFDLSTCLLSF
ncbi:hypothetical protein FORC9_4429 [Vibrio vulnificus]|nr:hypothetical protein FORC9_4429 [Vibrio vulnificus]ANH66309.1 hypothetical protein FORC16_4426 [Vibrio vulnificus]